MIYRFLLFLLTIGCFLFPSMHGYGQFVRSYDTYLKHEVIDLIHTSDGGYAMLGPNNSPVASLPYLLKTDMDGHFMWQAEYELAPAPANMRYNPRKVFQTPDGGYMIFGHAIGDSSHVFIIRTDINGNFLWQKEPFYDFLPSGARFADFVQTTDGGYAGYYHSHQQTFGDGEYRLIKFDAAGDTLWTEALHNIPGGYPRSFTASPNGGVTLAGDTTYSDGAGGFLEGTQLAHFDAQGNLAWSQFHGVASLDLRPKKMASNSQGNYAIITQEETQISPTYGIFPAISVFDSLGNLLWRKQFDFNPNSPSSFWHGAFNDVVGTADQGWLVVGESSGRLSNPVADSVTLIKLDSLGVVDWIEKAVITHHSFYGPESYHLARNIFGGYALGFYGGPDTPDSLNNFVPLLLTTDSTGVMKTNTVSGTVFTDLDIDCALGQNEVPYQNMLIRFRDLNLGMDLFVTSDNLGQYSLPLFSGDYLIDIFSPSPYLQWICGSGDTLSLSNYEQDTVDIPLVVTQYCPYNHISITSPFFSFNFPSQIFVQACNTGTAPSLNTQVEVQLDSQLSFLSAIPAPSMIVGQTLFFDLDTLDIGECQDIEILAQLDTLALAGATHCVEASITPDTVCIPSLWTGALIEAETSCDGDSIAFTLTNRGADMLAPRATMVYIDDVIFLNSTFQLDSGISTTIKQPLTAGATYRIEAYQEVGFPAVLGDSIAIAFREGCLPFPDGTFNTGFITQFYLGNSAPSKAIFCQENIAAYDPNDKLAQPTGYGPDHLLYPETPIDYTIRFQNTGNDTARRVIVLDTLSEFLDPATIELGASSHPYQFSIIGQNVLRFTFEPIVLPDSSVDLLGSQGFFSFRIRPTSTTPLGTQIENSAAIYFDFAPPVITNAVFHTIGIDFVPWQIVSIDDGIETSDFVKVWPNPLEEYLHFEVQQATFKSFAVKIYDTTGRLILQQTSLQDNHLQIPVHHLPSSVYVYQIESEGKIIGRGKLMANR